MATTVKAITLSGTDTNTVDVILDTHPNIVLTITDVIVSGIGDDPFNSTSIIPPHNDPRRGSCDNLSDFAKDLCQKDIKARLDILRTGGTLVGLDMAAASLDHYLNGAWETNRPRHVSMFVNPDRIFRDYNLPITGTNGNVTLDGFMNTVDGQFELKTSDAIIQYNISAPTLFNGQPVSMLASPVTYTNPLAWQKNARFIGKNMESSLGTSTVQSRSKLGAASPDATFDVTYRLGQDSTGQTVIIMEVSQQLELYDFYDWCGYNHSQKPQSQLFRFFSADLKSTPPAGLGPLEYDDVTGIVTQLASNADVTAAGFILEECPPDSVDQGRLRDNDASTSPFGTYDHPNAFYTGDFTALEKADWAAVFDEYSTWTHTLTYYRPYTLDANGNIQITGPALLIQPSTFYSPYAGSGSTDYTLKPLQGVGYVPSSLYLPDPRPY
ncbi:MAG: hypothetical protein ABI947_03095 [Chloroflexota bacterium]